MWLLRGEIATGTQVVDHVGKVGNVSKARA